MFAPAVRQATQAAAENIGNVQQSQATGSPCSPLSRPHPCTHACIHALARPPACSPVRSRPPAGAAAGVSSSLVPLCGTQGQGLQKKKHMAQVRTQRSFYLKHFKHLSLSNVTKRISMYLNSDEQCPLIAVPFLFVSQSSSFLVEIWF